MSNYVGGPEKQDVEDRDIEDKEEKKIVKAIGKETFYAIVGVTLFFGIFAYEMGISNMFGTMMATAHDLIINTVLFIMAVAVIAGAVTSILAEFGVISLINKILSPLMKPLYNLPGAAALGVITTYFSDNPAIISLGDDPGFLKYFNKRQKALLTNLGTAFGMGLIVSTFMLGLSSNRSVVLAVIVGNIGTIVASIFSVRLMSRHAREYYGDAADEPALETTDKKKNNKDYDIMNYREIREGNIVNRVMSALLDGGKTGVDLGLAIIPGNVIICTIVMMLVHGPAEAGVYTGAAYEGIAFFPWLGSKLSFILEPMYGFTSPEALAFPFTSIGSVGAALGMLPSFLENGLIKANDIAVFTAMGMSFSGYLSVHVGMMDALGLRELATKAILSHTIAVIGAGAVAHWLFVGLSALLL